MMRAVLAVFLVSTISICVFPQTVIKEKVEITPKQKVYHSVQGNKSLTISARFTWENASIPGLLAVFACDRWYTNPDSWSNTGVYAMDVTVPSTQISIRYYANVNEVQVCKGHLTVYLDGTIIYDFDTIFDGPFLYQTPGYNPFEINFNPPEFGDFALSVDDLMCRNGTSGDLTLSPAYSNCSSPNTFDSSDVITVSITAGSEYVSVIKN
jgi:hypothetical protein